MTPAKARSSSVHWLRAARRPAGGGTRASLPCGVISLKCSIQVPSLP